MRTHALVVLILLIASAAGAQNPVTGFPPFGSFQDGGFDSVNRQNLNVNFAVQVMSSAGRGQNFGHTLIYDSLIWKRVVVGTNQYAWRPVTNDWDTTSTPTWGWKDNAPKGSITYTKYQEYVCTKDDPQTGGSTDLYGTYYSNYAYVDSSGTRRNFDIAFFTTYPPYCGTNPGGPRTGFANDGSGFWLNATTANQPKVKDAAGMDVTNNGSWKDANGNFISKTVVSATETQWTDTLGRLALKIIKRTSCSAIGGGTYPNCTDYKYRSSDGVERTITVHYQNLAIKTGFACANTSEYDQPNQSLPMQIDLPNSQKYTIAYEPTWNAAGKYTGRISRITLPTGGYYDYFYPNPNSASPHANNGINCTDGTVVKMTRTISAGEATPPAWNYSRAQAGADWKTTVTDPMSNVSTFTFNANRQILNAKFYAGAEAGTPLRQINTTWATNGTPASTTVVLENGTTQATTTTSYDSFGLLIYRSEGDWTGSVVRATSITYLRTQPYLDRNILTRPLTVTVEGPSGGVFAKTEYIYDETNYVNAECYTGVAQHDDTNYGCSMPYRGLPTTIRNYTSASQWVPQSPKYDNLGNVVSVTDNGLHTTTLSYANNWSPSSTCGSVTLSSVRAYPTEITNHLGHKAQSAYYPCTGQVQSVKDQNDINAPRAGTTFTYDLLGRPTQSTRPDGGESLWHYHQDTNYGYVREKTLRETNAYAVGYSYFDSLGRTIHMKLCEDGTDTCSSPAQTDVTYDTMGRQSTVSNPHRPATLPTDGVTTTEYDALGRVTKVIPPDGSTSSNRTLYQYSLNTVTVTDPAGKQRKTTYDALGRVIQVDEPNPTLTTPAVTTYTYDRLDNLLTVTQSGSRSRSFTYNWLGQVLTSTTPEAGTVSNVYDSEGKLSTTTSPKPNQTNPAVTVTTTFTYDALHRLTRKDYNDGTASSWFRYDNSAYAWANPVNAIGRLTEAERPCHSVFFHYYDAMGRVTQENQHDPVDCGSTGKATTYTYNLAGQLLSYTTGIPGVTFTNGYNSAGHLSQITSNYSSPNHPSTLASGLTYTPAQTLSQFDFGNGLRETRAFNNRTQPTQMRTFNPSTSVELLNLNYGFNAGTANNGNVVSWSASGQQSFSRAYTYDALNRLATMSAPSETGTGLCWNYDIWGNRTGQQLLNSGACATPTVTISTTNRIVDANYVYDAAGNLINEPGVTRTFDAENRLISSNSTLGTATYVYDALGRRTAKVVDGLRTRYIYDLSGNVVLDMVNGMDWTNGYVYLGSQRLAMYRNAEWRVDFFHSDHLGSTRVLTKFDKTVVDNYDYKPFGEQTTGGSAIRFKFTGLEGDAESNLDHTWFRKYSSTQARWLSPDPLGGSVANPQSLNRYSYVLNDPLNLVDPFGLIWICTSASGIGRECHWEDDPQVTTLDYKGSLANPGALNLPPYCGQVLVEGFDIGSNCAAGDWRLVELPSFKTERPGPSDPQPPVEPPCSADGMRDATETESRSVLDFALAQIGDPYVSGARGPTAFDCTGLVTYCIRNTVNPNYLHTNTRGLPTNTGVRQLGAGEVPRPGDIALFPGHAGFYDPAANPNTILSARSGLGRVSGGRPDFFRGTPSYYRVRVPC